MKIYPFSVGPIVGAVTPTSIRCWGRGLKHIEETDSLTYLGVARIKPASASDFSPPQLFALSPQTDHTGIIDFSNLLANTRYDYQMGWLPVEQLPDKQLAELNWEHSPHQGRIKTASLDPTQSRTFVFGSCRYLLRIYQFFFWNRLGDRIFRQIQESGPIDRFLMLGDQIYADDLGVIFPDQTLEEYNHRYRVAFAQPHLRQLMATTPTAMMLDDHEITNNWPVNPHTKQEETPDNHPLYNNAIQAFYNYQLRHSPAVSHRSGERKPQPYWYQFQDGCCDFFIADARTERSLSQQKIISDRQMDAIKTWLDDGRDRVKILASSVLIFPDSVHFKPNFGPFFPREPSFNPDQWCGFRTQQMELLDFIRQRQIQRVVFISGDVHASFSATLTHPDDPNFQIISIVSSPFFWPVGHGKAKKFQLKGNLGRSRYVVHTIREDGDNPVMSHDNFTRVTITPDSVQVTIIPRQTKFLFWRQQRRIERKYSFPTG